MSKIIGVTVGTQLPKPNFKQTDPTKGDYIKNKPDFEGLKSRVTAAEEELAQKQPIGDYALKSEIPTNYLTKIPDEYVTESELATKGYLTSFTESDPTVPSWAKQPNKPTYTASEVGALSADTVIPTVPTNVSAFINDAGYLTEHQSLDGLATESYVNTQIAAIPTPDVSGQINAHNTATTSHNDIRLLVEGLTTRLNTLANSDDTTLDQMSEIVAYIKSNKSLIDGITTNKVNVTDIIDNLTTNVSNKPLSAAQGVALKVLIDAITVPTKLSQLTNDKGYLTSFTETDPTVPAWAKEVNKPTYTASEVGAADLTHTHKWTDIENPVCGEVGGDTLTWDGNTEGRESFEDMYFVSDVLLSLDDITTGAIVTLSDGSVLEFTKEDFLDESEGQLFIFIDGAGGQIISEPTGFGGSNTPGIYFPKNFDNGIYVTSLTISGFTGFSSIKKLDTKFLPDNVAMKNEIPDIPVPTEADEGKFLRVVNGVPTWVSIPNAEEATF